MTVSPVQKTNTNVMPCHELTMFWVYIEGYVSIYVEYHSFQQMYTSCHFVYTGDSTFDDGWQA